MIIKGLVHETLPVYGDGLNVQGEVPQAGASKTARSFEMSSSVKN
jgi:hypothetical protein